MYKEFGSMFVLVKVPEGINGFERFERLSLKGWIVFCSIDEIVIPWGIIWGDEGSYLTIVDPLTLISVLFCLSSDNILLKLPKF